MLNPPADLADHVLTSALAQGWGIDVTSPTYRPVGFGSHHWEVVAAEGIRWFVTVDDLATKRRVSSEPPGETFDRLRAALTAAAGLREHGRTFVVAPAPGRGGAVLARLDELEAALGSADDASDSGPYARPSAALLAGNATPIRRLLAPLRRTRTGGPRPAVPRGPHPRGAAPGKHHAGGR